MNVLMFAKPVVRRLTVPEGLTTQQVLAQIDHTEGLEGKIRPCRRKAACCPRPMISLTATAGRR